MSEATTGRAWGEAEVERLTRERDEARRETTDADTQAMLALSLVRADRDRLAVEVERLTRERDEKEGQRAQAQHWLDVFQGHQAEAEIAKLRAEADRGRLAAALAEVRDEALLCGAPRVTRVAAMAVADLAAARDARVRAAYAAHLLAEWGASEPVAGWLRARVAAERGGL